MGKIPDEILLIIIMVVAARISSMVRALLPYDPEDRWTPSEYTRDL
jgi:hypothetical protein